MKFYSDVEKPRGESSRWLPADERHFIRSLVEPDPKLKMGHYLDPIKALSGYISGLPKRQNWPPHFTADHIKDLAKDLLFDLMHKRGLN